MKKLNIKECLKKIPDSGFTLMEVMVSVGIAGIVMLVFGSLMSQSASFSSFFNSSASSIEGAADVVANVNAVLPQVVSVHTCRCRGSALPNNLSNCIWDDSTPWYDPVHNGGADDSAATGLSLIVGEIEMFNGGTNVANTTQLLRSNIAASNYMNNIGGCLNYTAFPAAQLRGCKMNFQINYKAPDIEVGSTPAKAGFVFIRLGDS
ncbi:MAG: prepilin-type N-terminal cleavage/methylation domain-containing protein, partial [Oligoflexia bacterium]|nr:prepilin-type N-terminal cleavage/methylation domain-containing protein [Oligoflexia bacterium]